MATEYYYIYNRYTIVTDLRGRGNWILHLLPLYVSGRLYITYRDFHHIIPRMKYMYIILYYNCYNRRRNQGVNCWCYIAPMKLQIVC